WQSLAINFVMVFSPTAFRGAPNTHIATLTYPIEVSSAEETALLKAMAEAFPAVAAVRVRDALDTIGRNVANLMIAVRAPTALTLTVATLVLAGALAAGHRQRVYDAVILKTLGATRMRLLAGYALEYFTLGSVTALLAIALGSAAAALVVTGLMNLPFFWLPG